MHLKNGGKLVRLQAQDAIKTYGYSQVYSLKN